MLESAPYIHDFRRLALNAPAAGHPVLLTSAPGRASEFNRFSVAAVDPIAIVEASEPRGPIEARIAGSSKLHRSYSELKEALGATMDGVSLGEPPRANSHLPLTGGWIGFVSYESGARFERMPERAHEPGPPALWFGLYTDIYVADHERREGWRIGRENGSSIGKVAKLSEWIASGGSSLPILASPEGADLSVFPDWRERWQPSLSASEYRRAVEGILDYLVRGDAYQVNLTVRHRRPFEGDPAALFAGLLETNPAPFSAYLHGGDWAILSSSPELLLDLNAAGEIQTRPIKGTRRIGGGKPGSLAESGKDRAEHLMIVDLERNDLGRICRSGSIRVDPFMQLQSYPSIEHMVSAVHGTLRDGLGPVDALAALFPGGSVTGAPKIRAMEIIGELEPVPRGIYCGALGWISPEGESRFNLPIRTMTWQRRGGGGLLDLHVGGGIVADSDAEAESEECRLKGEAMANAVDSYIGTTGLSD